MKKIMNVLTWLMNIVILLFLPVHSEEFMILNILGTSPTKETLAKLPIRTCKDMV